MNVVILGAGGHGRVVLDALRRQGTFNPVGFIDADTSRIGTAVGGLEVLGPVNLLSKLRREQVLGAIVAIGDSRVRRSYAALVLDAGLELISVIHPSAVVSAVASTGKNVLIGPAAVVGPDALIGDSAIVNSAAVIEHDCIIGAGAHVAPGAVLAGRVHVGEGALIGIGARILPCMNVGANAVVGAGAVIREDVPPGATIVGVPGRLIRLAQGVPS